MRFYIIVTAIALCALQGAQCATASQVQPNILLFITDDQGWNDVGCYGSPDARTPNMDRLAREGMRFTRAFAASPSCSPSRSALYTGLMPERNGCQRNHTAVRADVKSLSHYLKPLGYRVVLAGKYGVKPASAFPFERISPRPRDLDFKAIERVLASSVEGAPVCLVVCSGHPHVPWVENDNFQPQSLTLPVFSVDTPQTRAARCRYLSSVSAADEALGKLLEIIDRHGLTKRTLLVCTSDQGDQWPHAKWTLYDRGTRVPFIVRWPGVAPAGSVSEAMISFVDVLPTFVQAAGGVAPTNIDGRSFLPVLKDPLMRARSAIFTSHEGDGRMNQFPCRAIRTATHKYILNLAPERTYTSHITLGTARDGRDYWDSWVAAAKSDSAAARLVNQDQHRPREELYDLCRDPAELHNIAGEPESAAILNDLRRRLGEWRRQQGDIDHLPEPYQPLPPRAAQTLPGRLLVPTSERRPQTWRYTLTRPADGWQQPDFDDDSWQRGPGAFGKVKALGRTARTLWTTPDIWLRRDFHLDAVPLHAALRLFHDEDIQVFLNGHRVVSRSGYVSRYVHIPLPDDALDTLRAGGNVVAVHCHQTIGGQGVDVGIIAMDKQNAKEMVEP